MTSSIVYLNGKFLLEDEAFIPVTDRGFLFGEGIFTTIRVCEELPEYLEAHLEKLAKDCELAKIPYRKVQKDTITALIEKNHALSGVWRLKIILTAGQFLMTLQPYVGHPAEYRLTVYPYPSSRPLDRLKSLAYMDRLWMADYALKRGFDDVLVLNSEGEVLETSVANIFWREKQTLYFPDSSLSLYQGITLQRVLQAGKQMGMQVIPVKEKLRDISEEAQFYLCNSLRGVVPVVSIDERICLRDLEFEYRLNRVFSKGS